VIDATTDIDGVHKAIWAETTRRFVL